MAQDSDGPLFAASDEGTAGLVILAGLVGGAITWAANWFSGRRDKKRQEGLADEETAITRLEKLLKRVDDERKELSAEVDALRARCGATEIELARAITWIKMTQAILTNAKIAHPPWTEVPTGDTGRHAALSESASREGGTGS